MEPTPAQTIGPVFAYALPYAGGPDLVSSAHPDAVRLRGTVLDGAGLPVPDALVEIWQAGPDGRPVRSAGSLHRDGFTFTGWGRAASDNAGHYWFTTLAPGAATEGGVPFIAMAVFARGLLDVLFTRVYLPGHPGLDEDPLLASVPPDRRDTLLARRDGSDLVFDVVLQGERETVFLTHAPH
jgi:protocatechuate 3,4-dioxygenase alpha subunit